MSPAGQPDMASFAYVVTANPIIAQVRQPFKATTVNPYPGPGNLWYLIRLPTWKAWSHGITIRFGPESFGTTDKTLTGSSILVASFSDGFRVNRTRHELQGFSVVRTPITMLGV